MPCGPGIYFRDAGDRVSGSDELTPGQLKRQRVSRELIYAMIKNHGDEKVCVCVYV